MGLWGGTVMDLGPNRRPGEPQNAHETCNINIPNCLRLGHPRITAICKFVNHRSFLFEPTASMQTLAATHRAGDIQVPIAQALMVQDSAISLIPGFRVQAFAGTALHSRNSKGKKQTARLAPTAAATATTTTPPRTNTKTRVW